MIDKANGYSGPLKMQSERQRRSSTHSGRGVDRSNGWLDVLKQRSEDPATSRGAANRDRLELENPENDSSAFEKKSESALCSGEQKDPVAERGLDGVVSGAARGHRSESDRGAIAMNTAPFPGSALQPATAPTAAALAEIVRAASLYQLKGVEGMRLELSSRPNTVISVDVQLRAQSVWVNFTSDEGVEYRGIQTTLPSLRSSLESKGITVGGLSATLGTGQDQTASDQGRGHATRVQEQNGWDDSETRNRIERGAAIESAPLQWTKTSYIV